MKRKSGVYGNMISDRRQATMKKIVFMPLACGFVLWLVLLTACGSDTTTTATASSTTKQIGAAKPTPGSKGPSGTATVSAITSTPTGNCTATYGCGVGSSSLTPYRGSGYTIDYPGSWLIKSDGSNGTIFSMPDGSASFHVFVQDSTSLVNPLQYEFGTVAKDNCKAVGSITQPEQISGQTWQQSQFVCTPADNGLAGGKVEQIGILLATNVYNGKYYSMDYVADPATFNNTYQTFFRPMAASFKLA
jgi:hypothetical protein